ALNSELGWDLETEARAGRALSSVVKTDHGRSVPYESALWVTFYRRARGGKRDDGQLFVRGDARGVAAGVSRSRAGRCPRGGGGLKPGPPGPRGRAAVPAQRPASGRAALPGPGRDRRPEALP